MQLIAAIVAVFAAANAAKKNHYKPKPPKMGANNAKIKNTQPPLKNYACGQGL